MINRRNFIQRTGLTMAGIGVVAAAPGRIFSNVIGANEKLTCGLIGANGMGMSDLKAFLALPDTHVKAQQRFYTQAFLGG